MHPRNGMKFRTKEKVKLDGFMRQLIPKMTLPLKVSAKAAVTESMLLIQDLQIRDNLRYSQCGEFHRKFKSPGFNVWHDVEMNPAVRNETLKVFTVSKQALEEKEMLCISTENS